MASGSVEDDATDGDHQHIARICSGVADDRYQDQHGSEKTGRRHFQQLFQTGIDKTGLLGHPDPQHGHQHDAQRGKAGKGGHHGREKLGQTGTGQQVVDHYRLPGTGVDQIKLEL